MSYEKNLPIDNNSDIYDVFVEIKKEQLGANSKPVTKYGKIHPEDIVFDDNLGFSSLEKSFFGDNLFKDDSKA